jgi:hypothetical protein
MSMTYRLRAALVALLALLLAGVMAAPAGAITGGTYDVNNKYSNVGIIAWYDAEGRWRCSATLVTPTVLLTAAHCTDGAIGKTIVSFDKFIDDAPPSNLPRAADDSGDGISKIGYQAPVGGWYTGTAYAHPDYSNFAVASMDRWNDVGVVVLDSPVTGITPAKLAPLNYLNQFAQPRLNKTVFTTVGYGTEVRKADSGPQKPTPMSYPIMRRYTDVIGQKLSSQILQVNGNEHDPRAGGGTCFGDSGGPTFKNGYVVAVTSYGYTSNCRYLDGLQRVDIAGVQRWLATFGVLPAR